MTDMRRTVALLVGAARPLLGGCASTMSGLGGEGSYACKARSVRSAPRSRACTRIRSTASRRLRPAEARQGTREHGAAATGCLGIDSRSGARLSAIGTPLPTRVLRLWIAPWGTPTATCTRTSVVHVLVDTGRWLIEARPPAIDSASMPCGLDPVRAPHPARHRRASPRRPSDQRRSLSPRGTAARQRRDPGALSDVAQPADRSGVRAGGAGPRT